MIWFCSANINQIWSPLRLQRQGSPCTCQEQQVWKSKICQDTQNQQSWTPCSAETPTRRFLNNFHTFQWVWKSSNVDPILIQLAFLHWDLESISGKDTVGFFFNSFFSDFYYVSMLINNNKKMAALSCSINPPLDSLAFLSENVLSIFALRATQDPYGVCHS